MKKLLNLPHLIYYITIAYILGAVIGLINPTFYENYLSLNYGEIFHGQIWRLITWIFYPKSLNGINLLFFGIEIFFYYFTGIKSEEIIGTKKFNIYYLIGFLSNLIAGLIIYLIFGISYPIGIEYLNQSLFFLYAILYAENTILFMFIIPLKVKWLGIIYALFIGWNVIKYFMMGGIGIALGIAILVTFSNVIWFLLTKNKTNNIISFKTVKKIYKNNEKKINKCAVCGSIENLRFCSKCQTDLCYCPEHIKNHNHK